MQAEVNAKSKVCGLIGNPVGHSLSPLIHNSVSSKMGINLVYTTFQVESDSVDVAIKGAYALNIAGLNVTVPHKVAVMNSLVDIDEFAKEIGACNTLVRVEGGYKGYNTDYIGLSRQLAKENIPIKGEDVIILGAGGASRAVNFMCGLEGVNKVYLLNRTLETAEGLAADVNKYFGRNIVVPMRLSDYKRIPKGKYTCIQTTSIGLSPNVDLAPIEDPEFYKLLKNAVDIIFNPVETKFMKLAKEQGAKTANGLKMLLYQGIAAYELWNNVIVSDEIQDEVLKLLEEAL